MILAERIDTDITTALKARDAQRVDVLRFLKSSLHNAKIAQQKDLQDTDVEKVLASEVKRRTEAVAQFRSGGREDLAKADEVAIEIIKQYLPEAISEADLEALVKAQITKVSALGPADFGKVMSPVMSQVGTRADGKTVQVLVKKLLTPS